MKRWTINATIETEDDYDPEKIADQIDRDANRGDGIYIAIRGNVRSKIKPKKRKK